MVKQYTFIIHYVILGIEYTLSGTIVSTRIILNGLYIIDRKSKNCIALKFVI